MRFADDLLERYLCHFDDHESDSLDHFIQSILEQMDHKDLLEICKGCHKEELHQLLANYLSSSIADKLRNTDEEQGENPIWSNVQ